MLLLQQIAAGFTLCLSAKKLWKRLYSDSIQLLDKKLLTTEI
jgi:hypothetical protein